MPTLSIIIPIYNVERYLRRCLDALVEQSLLPYEVILVNDGTPDNSGVIAKEYADKYPFMRYIEQENQGVSAARNKGLSLATGDFVTFCDPDDYFVPFFCEEIVKIIDQQSADLYHYTYQKTFSGSGREFAGDLGVAKLTPIYCDALLKGEVKLGEMMVWMNVYKRSIVSKYGIQFPEGIVIHEDEVFNLRYYRHSNLLLNIDKAFYVYYIREEGATSQSYGGFNSQAVHSFYRNAIILLEEWNGDTPQAVTDCISNYILQYFRAFALKEPLSKVEQFEVEEGLKEIMDTVNRYDVKLRNGLKYKLISSFFPLSRKLYRAKRFIKSKLLSK